METFKVKIIQHTPLQFGNEKLDMWHKNLVGTSIVVKLSNNPTSPFYIVDDLSCQENGSSILKKDCRVIDDTLVLQKGESASFLDYTIKNCMNDDGLVLLKYGESKFYETHLGNFGKGTKENVSEAKKYALLHFMLARPQTFAKLLASKYFGKGLHLEFSILKECFTREGLEVPEEITGVGVSKMIYFNNQPL